MFAVNRRGVVKIAVILGAAIAMFGALRLAQGEGDEGNTVRAPAATATPNATDWSDPDAPPSPPVPDHTPPAPVGTVAPTPPEAAPNLIEPDSVVIRGASISLPGGAHLGTVICECPLGGYPYVWRGDSLVAFNDDGIIKWQVQPEDEPDFQVIREAFEE